MTRVARIDYLPATIEVGDALVPPTPATASAVRHPEGYLEVDAFIARDGLLRYSDGKDSWLEYRPRSELEAAAASWAHAPVTDQHPSRMVTADSWADVARGVVIGSPVVEGPYPDGVSYLRARLLIGDADLVAAIEGGRHEISIGFTSEVLAKAGTDASGARYDAVQTALDGNHVASVPHGRAGPSVRVLLDGAQVPVHFPLDTTRDPMTNPRKKKADEIGAPTLVTKVIGPDGQEVEIPTWAAAKIEEAAELRAELAAMKAEPPPSSDPAPMDAPPPAPEDPPTDDAAGDPAAPPGEPPADEEDEEEEMTPDKIDALVRSKQARLTRLARLADRAGVPTAIVDSADETAIARAFVAKRMPWIKADADKASGAVLDALVEAAAKVPEEPPSRNVFERPRVDAADRTESAPEIRFLERQGFAARA